MCAPLRLRPLTEEEVRVIGKLVRSQTASVRLVHRAKIVHLASQGQTIPQITAALGCAPNVVRKWFKRFAAQGLAGLDDAPRSGAPARYTADQKAQVLAAALTCPQDLGLSYSSWTFERLAAYVREHLGLPMKKTRIFEILRDEGLRWRKHETWFGERLDPEFAQKRGSSKA
ncbi:MAG: helix-turn-helix domain-containing protein [Ktedonobacterales bacterium]|nr:helix-turn-helix domain-containing protein [Ktedonobacterales bacterium]